jgi:pimeloyl-ACP methyl ester carboxylesterase
MHPAVRERYVEAPRPQPLSRVYVQAMDGWRSSLLFLPPMAGRAGEPVLLLHALGFGAEAFRYGTGPTLAESLSRAGFSVYLLQHRGDRDAVAPEGGAAFSFDDIIEHDLPAAMAAIRTHSGYRRVHAIGHGLGGQLGLAYAGRFAGDDLATVVAMCAPMRFAVPRSEALRASLVAGLLPPHWSLPSRRFGPLVAPWVDAERTLGGRVAAGVSSPARVRGVLHHAVEDVPVPLLKQLASWLLHGSVVDRSGLFDYTEALAAAGVPLLVGVAQHDRVCPPLWGLAAMETWGGPADSLWFPDAYGHLDPLFAPDAEKRVFEPIVAWLSSRRKAAW